MVNNGSWLMLINTFIYELKIVDQYWFGTSFHHQFHWGLFERENPDDKPIHGQNSKGFLLSLSPKRRNMCNVGGRWNRLHWLQTLNWLQTLTPLFIQKTEQIWTNPLIMRKNHWIRLQTIPSRCHMTACWYVPSSEVLASTQLKRWYIGHHLVEV